MAEAFARWQSLRADVRAGLADAVPDRGLLVLYALVRPRLALSRRGRAPGRRAPRPRRRARPSPRTGGRRPADPVRPRRLRGGLGRSGGTAPEAASACRVGAPPVAVPLCHRRPSRTLRAPTRPRRQPARPPVARAASRPAATRARPTRWVWRVAALAAVVAFAGILTTIWTRDAGWETVVADGARTVTFADGSTADLADGARLVVPEDGAEDARQARLLFGRALFRIERDAVQPRSR